MTDAAPTPEAAPPRLPRGGPGSTRLDSRVPLLFLNVLIIATCGLVYELLAGTLASYVLGDSVTQFSVIIGIYLSALGAGAWLSKAVKGGVARRFVEVELGVALVGGLSAPLLLLAFSRLSWFPVVLYGVVFVNGALVGVQLPLLMRVLEHELAFEDLVSRVLAFDYLGALVGSLLFPLFFVPRLGLVRTSLVFGLLDAFVGLWGTWLLAHAIGPRTAGLRARCAIVIGVLVAGLVGSDALTKLGEEQLFQDEIVWSKTTPYQRLVVTSGKGVFHLFLNGNLQFSSADEYRYHEALVHPALVLSGTPRRVLVLGGGDGLAMREILKHPSVKEVQLVDLDPGMTSLSREYGPLAELNGRSFDDARVHVTNEDAMAWIAKPGEPFDAAIVDFPDPSSFPVSKLFTRHFYQLLRERLTPDAGVSVQCTSPLVARKSFWCIVRTLEAAGFAVRPYQCTVPSFGVWGFALARRDAFAAPARLPAGLALRFLDDATLAGLFSFPVDMGPVPVEINRLDNQVLVRYYESEWRRWN